MLAKDKSIEVDGYSGFVFTAKSGRPLMPNAVNNVLYNIVDAYNKVEVERAKKEHRKAELLPKFSAHVMRHTACTRIAECRMDVKVLQYIMGHAHIDVTMEVYNHIGELTRIEKEVARLDSIGVKRLTTRKTKIGVKFGVKIEKITISKEIRYLQTIDFKGFAKKYKKY